MEGQGTWNPAKYSFEAFDREYKRCAIFGYALCVYFLPIMTEFEKNNELLQLDEATIAELNSSGGGEALSNSLVDTLMDMRQCGLLDRFVNNSASR